MSRIEFVFDQTIKYFRQKWDKILAAVVLCAATVFFGRRVQAANPEIPVLDLIGFFICFAIYCGAILIITKNWNPSDKWVDTVTTTVLLLGPALTAIYFFDSENRLIKVGAGLVFLAVFLFGLPTLGFRLYDKYPPQK